MRDINDKLKERWKDRRKKSFNWTRILIMVAALVAILFVMTKLNQIDNISWNNSSSTQDSLRSDSLRTEQNQ